MYQSRPGSGKHQCPRITTPGTPSITVSDPTVVFSTVSPTDGDYDVDNLALGLKLNAWKKLLLLGNATIKLNDGGLRATVVPLVGISYSF